MPITIPVTPLVKQAAEIITAKKTVRGTTGERIKFRLRVRTADGPATGVVRVRVKGTKTTIKVRLKEGRAVVRLPRFVRSGTKKLVLTYLGNDSTARDTLKIRAVIRGCTSRQVGGSQAPNTGTTRPSRPLI